MSKAVARVEQKIIITGADNASDAIKKAQKSLVGLEKSTRKAGKASKDFGQDFARAGDDVAGRSGKLSTALSSLGDFAGKSEGSFRRASEAAGAFDDVLTLLPGPIGLGAAAVAGLTTVLYLQVKATQQAEARLRQAFSGQILADVRSLRNEFSLSAEASFSLGQALADSGKNAQDIRDDLRAVVTKAEAVGDDGSEAVGKFAAALSKGVTESDRLRNRLKTLGVELGKIKFAATTAGTALANFGRDAGKEAEAGFGKMASELDKAKGKLKELEAGQRGPIAALKERQGWTAKLAISLGASNKYARAEQKATQAQTVAIAAQKAAVEKITAKIEARKVVTSNLQTTLEQAAGAERADAKDEAKNEQQRVKDFNAKVKRDKAKANYAKARAASAKRKAQASKNAAYGLKQAVAGQRALLGYQRQDLDTEGLIAKARAATSKGTQAKIEAEKALIDIATRRKILEVQNSDLDPQDKTARIEAITAIARVETTAKIKAVYDAAAVVQKAEEDVRKQALAKARAQLAESLAPLQQAAQSLSRIGGQSGNANVTALGRGLNVAAQGALDLAKNLKDIPKATDAVAGAIGGVASIAIEAESRRTQKTLEAEKQRRLATATTESQRAAIVAEFEQKKADAVDAAEKRKAAILAVMELAKVAASYPNIPEMAAHGVAAAMFAGVAGGAFGGASSAAGGSYGGGAGGFNSPSSGGGGSQNDAVAGQNVTINFNQPLTTRQNIGKAVQGALRSLKSTGMAGSKGV